MFDRHLMRRRLRPTLLLQTIAAVVSIAVFVAVAALVGHGMNLWLFAGLVVLWVVALELGMLPAVLGWWAVRWAEERGGSLRSAWFTYSPDDAEAAERDRRRQETRDNPTLW